MEFDLALVHRVQVGNRRCLGEAIPLQQTDTRFVLQALRHFYDERGERLWGEPFERAIGSESDIAAMVDELALAIVNRLRLKLGPTRMQYPTDLTTLRTILEARRLRAGRGARSLAAVKLYETVIDAYPDHAPVLADLAATYGDLGAQFTTAAGNASMPPKKAKA